ncbi:Ca2+-binding RTX toxin-like protein [Labrenzia sp. EL_159]|nr:Ca2+-binding RTX toxin-like protein [Labrenzia sp. EL_162]MBG6193560.1 Ca2+-binding RTX toxin-like protein [Labrenzia sp. EL_159]
MPTNTILDIASGSSDFEILTAALGAFPDLANAAGDKNASLTVFAPTDQAFLNLANALDPSVGSDESKVVPALIAASELLSPSDDPTSFLKSVLTYHIAGDALDGSAVAGSNTVETLSGETIKPDSSHGGLSLDDKDPGFADPAVTNPAGSENGIVAENGIIHVIDNVLLPYDITFAKGGFLFTGRGPDAVIGSDHFDFISLGKGDDIANGLGGHDIIFGGRGSDLVKGGDGNDYLFGGRGKDTLEGGADNDYLNGGRGKDILVGEEGNDFLVGGRSADSFVFNPFREGEGHDVVADFNAKRDKLVLDLRDGDPVVLDAIAATGDPGLQFTDLLEFDTDPVADGLQAAVSLGASGDGDLLITHLTGTIELNGIPSGVDPAALLPAIEFLVNDDLFSV